MYFEILEAVVLLFKALIAISRKRIPHRRTNAKFVCQTLVRHPRIRGVGLLGTCHQAFSLSRIHSSDHLQNAVEGLFNRTNDI